MENINASCNKFCCSTFLYFRITISMKGVITFTARCIVIANDFQFQISSAFNTVLRCDGAG